MFAGLFRFTALNWDEGAQLHPDERFLARVVSAVEVPRRPLDYLRADVSTLNPRNRGYDFFVYGDLPVAIVRVVAESLTHFCNQSTTADRGGTGVTGRLCLDESMHPVRWTLMRPVTRIGRFVSSLFSLGSVLLAGLIAGRLFDRRIALVTLWLSAMCVLPIQAAHFFTVDSAAAFFILASFYALVRARREAACFWLGVAGVTAGAAIACRLNLLLFVMPFALGAWSAAAPRGARANWNLAALVVAAATLYLAIRVLMPSAFDGWITPDGRWIGDVRQASAIMSDQVLFPPGVQWTDRAAWWFPWRNMVVWGMGIPLGGCAWAGWARWGWSRAARLRWPQSDWSWRRAARSIDVSGAGLAWVWVAFFFAWQGGQWVASMRYFLPIYDLLIVFAAWLLVRLWEDQGRAGWLRPSVRAVVVLVVAGTAAWAVAFTSIYRAPNTRVAAAEWMLSHVQGPAVVAHEKWDDSLPFGGAARRAGYRLLEMDPYAEDTPRKREQLLDDLEAADYLVLSSNRLYASIPRQPLRYPFTTRYYRLLFAGLLGFEPIAEFTSYPRLGPVSFPDQETGGLPKAHPGSRVPETRFHVSLPPAEEAFSVYDHPRVLIFAKQPAFSRESLARQFRNLDLESAYHGFRPRAEGAAPTGLLFTPAEWKRRESDGRAGPGLRPASGGGWGYAAAWLAVSTLLGWVVFPVLFRLVPGIEDRGIGLARVFAIAVVAMTVWLASSLGVPANTERGVLLAAFAWLVLAVAAGWGWRRPLMVFLREHRRSWIASESVFVLAFVAATMVRAANPDLWHPVFGGEKPMDFAYLNTVLRSDVFPPHDPWFALGTLNYYYFGFVMVAAITKLTATPASIAYNLGLALWFALICQAAFSVAHNLSARMACPPAGEVQSPGVAVPGAGRNIASGLLAVLLVACIGNLEELYLLATGACSPAGNAPCLFWDATRAIPAPAGEAPPITEFPFFTFLYGDLHAHFLSLPVLLAVLGISMSWLAAPPLGGLMATGRRCGSRCSAWGVLSLLLVGMLIAVLRMSNAWDYPTALVFIVAVAGLAARSNGGSPREIAAQWVSTIALVLLAFAATSAPFDRWFATAYGSVELWLGSHTPVGAFVLLYGIFIVPFVLLVLEAIVDRRGAGTASPEGRALWVYFLAGLSTAVLVSLILRTIPVLVVVMPLLGAFWWLRRRDGLDDFAFCSAVLALLLCAAVEVAHLRGDVGRMNTVFKFSYHAWVLLAIPVAVVMVKIWNGYPGRPRWLASVSRAVPVALVCGGLLYPVFALPARLTQRFESVGGWGLDGMTFMDHARYVENDTPLMLHEDRRAIDWMRSHLDGLPVVAEGVSERSYQWGGRISVYTGLPTIIGWRSHEVQQKSLLPADVINARKADVNALYGSGDAAVVRAVLRRYHVSYVFVGELERAYYSGQSLSVFERMQEQGELTVAYRRGDTVLYAVDRPAPLESSLLQHVPRY